MSATKTVYATDFDIYIDEESFRNLGGTYIFSRWELTNADEAGLRLLDSYTLDDAAYTIYVYESKQTIH